MVTNKLFEYIKVFAVVFVAPKNVFFRSKTNRDSIMYIGCKICNWKDGKNRFQYPTYKCNTHFLEIWCFIFKRQLAIWSAL